MTGRRPEVLWLAGTALWLLAVSLGSLLSLSSPALDFALADKFLHLVAYGSLGLWLAALRAGSPAGWLLLAAACGLEVEWLQQLGGEREAEWLDALANVVGLLLGWVLGRALIWRLPGFRRLVW